MKTMMRKFCSIALVLALLLTGAVTAMAAETFNAGVTIQREGNRITVTVQEDDDAFLAAQSPRLSIVCDFACATVTRNGQTVEASLADGMVTFPVRASGTYVITGSGEGDYAHPDSDGDSLCDSCECNLGAKLESYLVSLQDNINMDCYLTLSDEVAKDKDAYLEITRPDGTVNRIPVSDAVESNGHYVFTEKFAAKEMTETVTIRMCMGDGTAGLTYQYSLRTYADGILNATQGYTDADRELVKAMLLYGAYAQKHFNYRTDALADKDLDLRLADVTAENLKAYANTARQGTDKVEFVGSSLLLKSETVLRLFFRVDSSVKDRVTFRYNGQLLTVGTSGSFAYVDISGIRAKDLHKSVSVTVNDGTEATVTYNPLTYCYNVLANPDQYPESLCNVVKALYLYHQTAKAYYGA